MEELLGRYFAGEASQEERTQVAEWRSQSEENARMFLEYKKVWSSAETTKSAPEGLFDEIIGSETHQVTVIPIWKSRSFQLAAMLVVVLAAVLFIYGRKEAAAPLKEITFSAYSDDHLPDGTLVTLFRGAKISYNFSDESRTVSLQGKAYFDVQRDESRPFVIHTGHAKVQVLGTSFVVDASTEEITAVFVESGQVAFMGSEENQRVELEVGEMGVLKGNQLTKSEIDNPNYLSWKTHEMVFRATSLDKVCQTIEDVYEVDIDVAPAISGCKLSATFNEKSIEEVMQILNATFDLRSEITANKIMLSGNGCH